MENRSVTHLASPSAYKVAKRLVVISGNLGAGKTSLAKRLASSLNWQLELESVDDNPYLTDFYADMRTWSLHLQFHFLGYRADQHDRALSSAESVLLDRSIYEDASVFATALHESGVMSDRDFNTYRRVFNRVAASLKPPDLIVYMAIPPEILMGRIKQRAQRFDQSISVEYLRCIDAFYERWIASVQFCPVLWVPYSSSLIDGYNYDIRSIIDKVQESAR
jgi:deoxyadenosine/deoxycytidine kinase